MTVYDVKFDIYDTYVRFSNIG